MELEQESDDRWIGEVPELPGVLAYGATRDLAMAAVEMLALSVLADRIEHGEAAHAVEALGDRLRLFPGVPSDLPKLSLDAFDLTDVAGR